MQITIVPASSSVGEAAVRQLLAHGSQPTVRAIYRNIDKAPEEFKSNPHFRAVRGDIGMGDLDFDTSEAVLYVVPAVMDGSDLDEFATRAANNVKAAIERAGTVKRLVVQSALGSQFEGIGLLRINTVTDKLLRGAAPRTFVVQPCTFYDTWKRALLAVRDGAESFPSYISPANYKIPMVSVIDIATHCVKVLLDAENSIDTKDVKIFGPRLYSPDDVKEAIATATGKPVKVEPVAPEDLTAWWSSHIPEKYVGDFTEFTTCQLEGGVVLGEYEYDQRTVRGTRELVDEMRAWLQ